MPTPGFLVIAGGGDIWHVDSASFEATLVAEFNTGYTDVAALPDGRILASGNETLYELDLDAAEETRIADLSLRALGLGGDLENDIYQTRSLVFPVRRYEPDGETVVRDYLGPTATDDVAVIGDAVHYVSGGAIRTFDRETGQIVAALVTGVSGGLGLHETDGRLIGVTRGGVVYELDATTGVEMIGEIDIPDLIYGSASVPGGAILGDDGDDEIAAQIGGVIVDGLAGDDRLVASRFGNELLGGQGMDELFGLTGDDILRGGADDDRMLGRAGEDLIFGGIGEDRLVGHKGDDMLGGGGGADVLIGKAGNDRAVGGGGADRVKGNGGDDELIGKAGNDVIKGGGGDDLLRGNNGRDRLDGQGGDDVLVGGRGPDVLIFRGGNDVFRGVDEADTIRLSRRALDDRDATVQEVIDTHVTDLADGVRFDLAGGDDLRVRGPIGVEDLSDILVLF